MEKRIRFSSLATLTVVPLLLAVCLPTLADCPEETLGVPQLSPQFCNFGAANNMSKKVMVSTRGGYQNGGFKVVLRDDQNQPVADKEVWLYEQDGVPPFPPSLYLEQGPCQETVCGGDPFPECPGQQPNPPTIYSYLEGVTDSNGEVLFQIGRAHV